MKLWPFVTRSAYEAVRALLAEAHKTIAHQRGQLRQLEELRDRTIRAETRYHELVTRLTERALPAPVVVQPPVAPLDPDVQTVRRLDDEVIQRMTESFIEHDRMSPEAAEAHARELAKAAEAMYLGG
jgi:hypothetical protein